VKLGRLRTWAEEAEAEDFSAKDALNKQILDTYNQLETYQSWEGLEEYIREEQQKAFIDIMNADGEHLILARERAKVYSKFLQRKKDLEQELERLHAERNALEE
jgi:cell division protein FtsB